jgi:hypothetical protein
LPRAAFFIEWHLDDVKGRRVFLPVKNNIGNDRDGFAFETEPRENGYPPVVWRESIDVDIDELLSGVRDKDETTSLVEQCSDWLIELLSEAGSMLSKDIARNANQCGLTDLYSRGLRPGLVDK